MYLEGASPVLSSSPLSHWRAGERFRLTAETKRSKSSDIVICPVVSREAPRERTAPRRF